MKAKLIHAFCIFAAAALFEVFLVLCALLLREGRPQWIYLLTLIGGSAVNAVLFGLDLFFRFGGREGGYKCCIIAYILLNFAAILFFVLLKTGFLEIVGDKESLEAYLERTGGWMAALFVALQFLQVVILPIPSNVTVWAGAALFGPLLGSLWSLLGIVLGSLVAFLIGRYAGSRVVEWMIGKETLAKWMKKVKGRDKLILSAMFLLPVFPDDVLCFVAGLSSMSLRLFLAVILVSRVIAIFTTSYSVTLIPFNTVWGIATWAVIGVCVAVLFVLLYKKSDAILAWFEKKFHRETRVGSKKKGKGEFLLEVVGPDGTVVTKGVERSDEAKKKNSP